MARVLIIDDDPAVTQALTKHVERAGHTVRNAADGDAGIRACRELLPEVVIVDIFMPGKGGLQTIGVLRREWPDVKIIAISAVTSAGSLDVGAHAMALGADRFVGKPFEAAAVVDMIAALTGGEPAGQG